MKPQQTTLIHLSLLLAVLFSMMPFPETIRLFMPYWTGLVIIYWSLNRPDKNLILYAFAYGLLLDILNGSLLGKHGFSMVAITFLVSKFNTQLRMTSIWQLDLIVVVLLLNDLLIRSLIDWLAYQHTPEFNALLPLLSALILWPWLKYLLDRVIIGMRSN
ncbi:rod shape-determining protein MreD [Marinicella sp. W31]|uniref:rod shape-determining protein MreD n=1 Tax=Marinicella sp. W31 TaxID=3023713 RepID=UPI0037570BAE